MAAVSEYTYCCSPCPMIFCFEQLTQQRFFYSVQPPAYPEGFKQMVLISLIFFLQIFHPGAHIIENLLFIVHPQFQTGTFTGAEFRELEIFEELFNRCASNLSRFDQWPGRIGNPVDPSMSVIPKRIAGGVVRMPAQHVIRVCSLAGAGGGDRRIRRPETRIES